MLLGVVNYDQNIVVGSSASGHATSLQGSAAMPNGPSCGPQLTECCLTQSFTLPQSFMLPHSVLYPASLSPLRCLIQSFTLPHSVHHTASFSPSHCLTQSFTLPHSVLHAASLSPLHCLTQSFTLPHSVLHAASLSPTRDSGERGKGSSALGQLKKTGIFEPINSFIILFLEM